MASGKALANGGPASLLICFTLIGLMMYCTVHALGELAVLFPVAGSFSAYSTRFLDPAWGFAMGRLHNTDVEDGHHEYILTKTRLELCFTMASDTAVGSHLGIHNAKLLELQWKIRPCHLRHHISLYNYNHQFVWCQGLWRSRISVLPDKSYCSHWLHSHWNNSKLWRGCG